MKNKNLIGFIATGIIGVLLIVVVVMIISNNNMLSVVKRSVDYKAMGLGKDKSSIILSAQELYNKKIITKKMYEKNKNSYVKLVLNKKNKLEIDYFYDLIKPVIILNGDTQINVEYQTEYQELGIISALDDLCGDLTSKVKITGEVDTNKLGEYVIAYSVSDLSGNKAEVKRIINVIDSKRPIISLKGLKELTLEVNSEYKESGYSAKDNHDGNLTDLVEIKGIVKNKQIGKYFLTYTVKDTSNNKASATRVINIIDYSKPVITLKGASTIVLEQGMQFIEDGFNVSDKYDADIESKVTVQSNVNMNEIGNYEIVYKVINSKGKESSIIRTVSVIEKSSAQITLNGDLEMSIPINSIFEEPGFSVTDKYDINLPVDIKVYNLKDDTVVDSIDTSAIGQYKIVYEVTNSRELTTYKERLVTVYDLSIIGSSEIVLPGTNESPATKTYTISCTDLTVDLSNVEWKVTYADNTVIPNDDIKIDENGIITITNLAEVLDIKIHAEIKGVKRDISVTIKKEAKLVEFEISGPLTFTLPLHEDLEYTIINPKDQYGEVYGLTETTINWAVKEPEFDVLINIDSDGKLTILPDFVEDNIIITATIDEIEVEFTINKAGI